MTSTDTKQLPIAELKSTKAKELADRAAIFQDLTFCVACCDRAIENLRAASQDTVLIRALWTAALVAYARCFTTGVRFGLTSDLFDHFEGEPRETHEYYLDLRNKHIAHSVNPFEQIVIGAVLSAPDAATKSVEGIATLTGTNISESAESIEQLRTLATTALKYIARTGKELSAEVLEEAKTLPIEDLYKRATPRVTVPPASSAGNRR
jgi:hypothetical protein